MDFAPFFLLAFSQQLHAFFELFNVLGCIFFHLFCPEHETRRALASEVLFEEVFVAEVDWLNRISIGWQHLRSVTGAIF